MLFRSQSDFFMVTDSRTVQTFHIARGRLGELAPLFSCERNELSDRFGNLYARVSKKALTGTTWPSWPRRKKPCDAARQVREEGGVYGNVNEYVYGGDTGQSEA